LPTSTLFPYTTLFRSDRQIYVDLPDVNERKQIFEVHLKNIKKKDDLDIDFLSKQTPGFSGADIANVCNEAALTAARKNKKEVDKDRKSTRLNSSHVKI